LSHTHKNVIECLDERGLLGALTAEDLRERCTRPIKVYAGFDPTADSLHLGNLVGIVVLRWFQKYGHTPVVVLGGATGRIGDPSGKSVERPLLEPAELAVNVRRIRSHFEQVLDFFHSSVRPVVVNNDGWFAEYALIDFLREIGKHFRVNVMLTKESVRQRIDSDEGISFTEFTYQLLQAYDFLHLFQHEQVELQVGGSDQWGNITAGIDLVRKLTGKSVFGLTFPLLTRSDGKKFGKTEEGAVWLAADRCSPYQLYQYLYRIPDADVIKLLRMITFLDMSEIRRIEQSMGEAGYVPNTAQKRLAHEVTLLLHGDGGVDTALKVTEATTPGRDTPLDVAVFRQILRDMPHAVLSKGEVVGEKFVDIVAKTGLLASKGEVVRLIEQGGAYLNNTKVDDSQLRLAEGDLVGGEFILLATGKKKKFLVQISPK
jgi:tyrosyl-tRNA synthetase